MQLEEYLRGDDRIVLPLGSTEQHAYLSLGTDNILAERVAVEAAEPLGVPVLPVLASCMENFPWTRLPGVDLPAEPKPLLDAEVRRGGTPERLREVLGDGSWGGAYARSDADVLRVWEAGVLEVRELLEHGWAP